jgi:hypothetical protein
MGQTEVALVPLGFSTLRTGDLVEEVSTACRYPANWVPLYKPQVKTSCRTCIHVPYGSRPRLAAEVGFGVATCPVALDLASLLRWASMLPCVLWFQTSPLG